MHIELNIGSIELDSLHGVNTAELPAAIEAALAARLNRAGSGLAQLRNRQMDDLDLEVDPTLPLPQLAERVAAQILQQLGMDDLA
jgi:hypothetical protein